MFPKVSIVTPVFNTGSILNQTISSVITQTFSDFEYILVDDFSNDQLTQQILRQVNDSRVKIIKNKKKGSAFAYNYGIQIAKGKYIAILDHDDLAYPNRLETQIKYFEILKNYSIIGSWYDIVDENGSRLLTRYTTENDVRIREEMLFKNPFGHSTIMMKKEVFNSGIHYRQEFFPSLDFDFYSRCNSKIKFYNIQECLVAWRLRNKNPSTVQLKEQNYKAEIIIKKNIARKYNSDKNFSFYLSFNLAKSYYYKYEVQKSFKSLFRAILSCKIELLDYQVIKWIYLILVFLPIKKVKKAID